MPKKKPNPPQNPPVTLSKNFLRNMERSAQRILTNAVEHRITPDTKEIRRAIRKTGKLETQRKRADIDSFLRYLEEDLRFETSDPDHQNNPSYHATQRLVELWRKK